MLPLSICMIAKNEEKHLKECLKRLKPLHCEIILVDTGSSDHTSGIARKYTDKVYHFDWIDDFSAARNFSAEKASNDWILAIDCDEYLENANFQKLAMAMEAHPDGVGMITRNTPRYVQEETQLVAEQLPRLFRRSRYRYDGIVHEQLFPLGGGEEEPFLAPLTFFHEGYLSETASQLRASRNLNLLLKVLKETGPDSYTCFQLGKSYAALRDMENACYYYDLGLSLSPAGPVEKAGYVQDMVESYGYCLLELRDYAKALQFAEKYDSYAVRADFVYLTGLIYKSCGLPDKAVEQLKKAVTMEEHSVEGVNSYSAFYNIGLIYESTGETQQALSCYRLCGDYSPALARSRKIARRLRKSRTAGPTEGA